MRTIFCNIAWVVWMFIAIAFLVWGGKGLQTDIYFCMAITLSGVWAAAATVVGAIERDE